MVLGMLAHGGDGNTLFKFTLPKTSTQYSDGSPSVVAELFTDTEPVTN
jgi:hypothetical protein